MKELGEHLKETRIKHGVSLEEAASDLNVSTDLLENLESANTKAFKDVYDIKKIIKEYAKYLGLDEVKVQDEFNDFLFEHTSKISLDDIMEAKKKKEEEEVKKEKKISSPYTKVYKQKKKKLPIIIGIIILVFFVVIAVLLIKDKTKKPIINSELRGSRKYEYTNQVNCS